MTLGARDHGGNLEAARSAYGGTDWIDLSTGINRAPYPVPPISAAAFAALPTQAAMAGLVKAAAVAYGTSAPILALSGAQAAIQLVPLLRPTGLARVVGPTYNEHAATLRACGWQVQEVGDLGAVRGADIGIVVNPNNPDGRHWTRKALLDLVGQVGLLVVDESFADPMPDQSLGDAAGQAGLLVLRSFGKFYGLAGLRLGFALGAGEDIARLKDLSGPWPVSGPAIEVATLALQDRAWAETTSARLAGEVARMDAICTKLGWTPLGGTPLFRLYDTPDAQQAQDHLARAHIWSRIFPYSQSWIRLGLPGDEAEWARMAALPRA